MLDSIRKLLKVKDHRKKTAYFSAFGPCVIWSINFLRLKQGDSVFWIPDIVCGLAVPVGWFDGVQSVQEARKIPVAVLCAHDARAIQRQPRHHRQTYFI